MMRAAALFISACILAGFAPPIMVAGRRPVGRARVMRPGVAQHMPHLTALHANAAGANQSFSGCTWSTRGKLKLLSVDRASGDSLSSAWSNLGLGPVTLTITNAVIGGQYYLMYLLDADPDIPGYVEMWRPVLNSATADTMRWTQPPKTEPLDMDAEES